MLAKYLKGIRASRVLASPQAAVSQLGSQWQVSACGNGLQKSYEFCDFYEASNFIQRYTDYCQKVNHVPQWSNVYNKVNVTLTNAEFNAVTEKEVSLGKYLDIVSKAHLESDNIDDVLSFEQVMDAAQIGAPATRNAQDQSTSLYVEDESKATLLLGQ